MERVIEFEKYHGLGNDFIIIDNREGIFSTDKKDIEQLAKIVIDLCDRHTGIGSDGIMFVENVSTENDKNIELIQADVKYRLYNNDGYEANICGNGLRCFVKYLLDHQIVSGRKTMQIQTRIGVLECEEMTSGLVRTQIGKGSVTLESIPALAINERMLNEKATQAIGEILTISENEQLKVTLVSTGNPHCIIYVDDVDSVEVEKIGKYIQSRRDILPDSANVEFVQVLSENHLKLRVYERGCGETLACGTGACAAVIAGIFNKTNTYSVTVSFKGGDLLISINPIDLGIQIIGSAKKIFQGKFTLTI